MYVKKAELGSAFFVGENKGFWRFVENNYMCEGDDYTYCGGVAK